MIWSNNLENGNVYLKAQKDVGSQDFENKNQRRLWTNKLKSKSSKARQTKVESQVFDISPFQQVAINTNTSYQNSLTHIVAQVKKTLFNICITLHINKQTYWMGIVCNKCSTCRTLAQGIVYKQLQ